MSAYQTLQTSLEAGVARVTLNRPEVRNALSRTMVQELEAALAAAEADDAARVIVLSGAGDKAFCAGRARRCRRASRSAGWRGSSRRWRGCARR